MFRIIIITITFLIFQTKAYAYLGPGMGVGAILAFLGLIIAIIASVFGLIWFPIKKILAKRKKKSIDNKENKID